MATHAHTTPATAARRHPIPVETAPPRRAAPAPHTSPGRRELEDLIEALIACLDAQDGGSDDEPDADDEPDTDHGDDDDGPFGANAARVADALAYSHQVNRQPLTAEQAARAFKWVQ